VKFAGQAGWLCIASACGESLARARPSTPAPASDNVPAMTARRDSQNRDAAREL
jgi:hypothetical protein